MLFKWKESSRGRSSKNKMFWNTSIFEVVWITLQMWMIQENTKLLRKISTEALVNTQIKYFQTLTNVEGPRKQKLNKIKNMWTRNKRKFCKKALENLMDL